MKVKLIKHTPEPIDVMWTAARTCYSEKSPIDMWNERYPKNIDLLDGYDSGEKQKIKEKHWKLVKTVLESGHDSIAQHVYFTFAIEGLSRACSHQLVRHRLAVFSQQSQRYVEIKEDQHYLEDLNFQNYIEEPEDETDDELEQKTLELETQIKEVLDNYFVDVNDKNLKGYLDCLLQYLWATHDGEKAEDARMFLPNATKTNIVMTMNLSELRHVAALRLCTRAQKEIRDLFKLVKAEVEKVEPELGAMLVPSCEKNHGICYEHKCCGRCPHISEVMEVYKEHKNDKRA